MSLYITKLSDVPILMYYLMNQHLYRLCVEYTYFCLYQVSNKLLSTFRLLPGVRISNMFLVILLYLLIVFLYMLYKSVDVLFLRKVHGRQQHPLALLLLSVYTSTSPTFVSDFQFLSC